MVVYPKVYIDLLHDFTPDPAHPNDITTILTDAISSLTRQAPDPSGGIILIAPGQYTISDQINVPIPVKIIGAGWGDHTTAANPPSSVTYLLWTGASPDSLNKVMFLFKSSTQNEQLFDCGIDALCMDGANILRDGVVFSSTRASYLAVQGMALSVTCSSKDACILVRFLTMAMGKLQVMV